MKIAAMVILALGMGGCVPMGQAAQGFKDNLSREAIQAVADEVGDRVDKKLGGKVDGLGDVVRGLPAALPKPPASPDSDPSKGTLWYGIGALGAYLAGSFIKGGVRQYQAKMKDDS